MVTKISGIDKKSLKLAKEFIFSGGVVAFPTETVYGLGANAFDNEAVKSIFSIKGRPADNPLIAHVHKNYDINKLAAFVPEYAVKLAKAYLPGPLTMVYKSLGKVSQAAACGLDTIAIRVPSHEGAQRFLEYLDLPIVAPSANISKHVSPVTAEHVYDDLKGKIPLILDGGKCSGGIESTVVDCTGDFPVILRSGLITQNMIENIVGRCGHYELKSGEKARSPGMKYKHYSPNCKTAMFAYNAVDAALAEYKKSTENGLKVYILCDGFVAENIGVDNLLVLGKTAEEIAANLYLKLREAEEIADLLIAIAPKEADGVMVGVLNRLTKACRN